MRNHPVLTLCTYQIPAAGINAMWGYNHSLILPGNSTYATKNWEEQDFLEAQPGVSRLSETTVDMPPLDQFYVTEAAVPEHRTRTYSIAPDADGNGVDCLTYSGMGWGSIHVKIAPGIFKTSDRQIQIALYSYPRVTMTADVATT
jgi:hypothetical protein